jgi:hypothetical protein
VVALLPASKQNNTTKKMTAYTEDNEERNVRHRMEVAALNEEIDRLLAALKLEQEKADKVAAMQEQIGRLTVALDEALGIVRARNAIRRQEEEAGL